MKKSLSTIILFFITIFSFATNYYVDATNGNDSNSGRSPDNAWQSIGKVNGFALLPEDSVLFKRGEIFRGNLIPTSGSALGNITYCDYGTGDKPKLFGSIQKNALSDWINEGGNIWHTAQQQSADSIPSIGDELLPDPDFNTDVSKWYLWNNSTSGASSALSRTSDGSEYYTSPGGGKLVCSNHGKVPSDIQLWTSNLSIKSPTWYRFVFKAKASQQFTIPLGGIVLMKNMSPYTNYSSSASKPVAFDTMWATYRLYFKAKVTAADTRIDFFLGNNIPDSTSFYIDSLSFKAIKGDPGFITIDVGNLIFDGESSCGIKVKNETDLNAQGKFWYDEQNSSLKLYSVSNPALFYSNIEIALFRHIIDETGKSYITYQNLDLRYGGAHGIGGGNTHHIQIKDLDISWIGGCYLPGYGDGKVRYGNGIEFWTAAHDNTVERCTFDQIYDAALTAQGSGVSYEAYNIYFINNIVNNSEYSFEFWGDPSTTSLHDIYFENNTCMNAGFGWGHTQRPDPNGAHLMFWSYQNEQTKNVFIRNNIFYESSDYGSRYDNKGTLTKFIVDYNCWYESSGPVALIAGKKYDYASQQEAFKSVSGQDAHSVFANPMFNSDYTLAANSPCIDAGIATIAVAEDFNRNPRPQGEKFDIGAFENSSDLTSENKKNINKMNFFPNPAEYRVTIETPGFLIPGIITICNLSGQELIKLQMNNNRKEIDIRGLQKGLYFMKFENGESVVVKKIIKE